MALPTDHAPVPASAVRVLRDPAGTLTPAEALARLRAGDTIADGALNAGITGDTFWAALRLGNAASERRTVVLAHDYASCGAKPRGRRIGDGCARRRRHQPRARPGLRELGIALTPTGQGRVGVGY